MQSTRLLKRIIRKASKRGPKKYSRDRIHPIFAQTTAKLLAAKLKGQTKP